MNEMFRGIEFIRAYIDELLIITRSDWSDHLDQLELVLKHLRVNRRNQNIKKSFFGKTEMEYLGFGMMQTRILRINKQYKSF